MSEHPTTPPQSFRRRVMPAGRALVVILVTLLVWAFLYAPELRRSAEAAPTGTRRTVSLAILNPLVWFTDHTGLTAAANAASRAAGRDPNAEVGGVNVGVDPLPSATPRRQEHHKDLKDTDIREPTPDRQLRVAIVGDSLAQGVGFAADSVFRPFWPRCSSRAGTRRASPTSTTSTGWRRCTRSSTAPTPT